MLAILDEVKNEALVIEILEALDNNCLTTEDALEELQNVFLENFKHFSVPKNKKNLVTIGRLLSLRLFPSSADNTFITEILKDKSYESFSNEADDSNFYEMFLRCSTHLLGDFIENPSEIENGKDLSRAANQLGRHILDKLGSTDKSRLWMLDELQNIFLIPEILKNFDEGKLSEKIACDQICSIIQINLKHFSAKEHVQNAETIVSLMTIKIFPSYSLNENRLQWLKEGKCGDLPDKPDWDFDESDFLYALPRGCSILLLAAKYSDEVAISRAAVRLHQYIESLGVLPNPDNVFE
jgi:hypothetical protein